MFASHIVRDFQNNTLQAHTTPIPGCGVEAALHCTTRLGSRARNTMLSRLRSEGGVPWKHHTFHAQRDAVCQDIRRCPLARRVAIRRRRVPTGSPERSTGLPGPLWPPAACGRFVGAPRASGAHGMLSRKGMESSEPKRATEPMRSSEPMGSPEPSAWRCLCSCGRRRAAQPGARKSVGTRRSPVGGEVAATPRPCDHDLASDRPVLSRPSAAAIGRRPRCCFLVGRCSRAQLREVIYHLA